MLREKIGEVPVYNFSRTNGGVEIAAADGKYKALTGSVIDHFSKRADIPYLQGVIVWRSEWQGNQGVILSYVVDGKPIDMERFMGIVRVNTGLNQILKAEFGTYLNYRVVKSEGDFDEYVEGEVKQRQNIVFGTDTPIAVLKFS